MSRFSLGWESEGHGEDRVVAGVRHATVEHDVKAEPLADLQLLVGGAVECITHRTKIVFGAPPRGCAHACGLGFPAGLGQVVHGDPGQVGEDRQPVVQRLLQQVGLGLRDAYPAVAAAHDLDQPHGHECIQAGPHLGRAGTEL